MSSVTDDLAQADVRSAAAAPPKVPPPRRSELLAQIEQIMLSEGFDDLNMDELARRLHCSKATLYGVAGSKRDLVVLVVKRFFELATRRIEEATSPEVDFRRKVKVYLRSVGREMGRHSQLFYRDMVEYAPAAAIYSLNSVAAARRVRELIDHGVEAGQFRAVDAAFTGELVVLAIDGVQSGRLLERTGLTAGEAFAEIADVLLDGLQYESGRRVVPVLPAGRDS